MSGAWRKEQGRDKFFRKAKEQGYRARSAFKLIEIVEKYGLIKPGSTVLDLGAAPGSWTQVAVELAGKGATLVAVDIAAMAPMPGVTVLQCDITSEECFRQMAAALGRPADVVLSDAAPSTTGVSFVDAARSTELGESALGVARRILRPGGNFVVKIFRGSDFDAYVGLVRAAFQSVHTVVPEATRKESREAFVVGLRLRGSAGGTS